MSLITTNITYSKVAYGSGSSTGGASTTYEYMFFDVSKIKKLSGEYRFNYDAPPSINENWFDSGSKRDGEAKVTFNLYDKDRNLIKAEILNTQNYGTKVSSTNATFAYPIDAEAKYLEIIILARGSNSSIGAVRNFFYVKSFEHDTEVSLVLATNDYVVTQELNNKKILSVSPKNTKIKMNNGSEINVNAGEEAKVKARDKITFNPKVSGNTVIIFGKGIDEFSFSTKRIVSVEKGILQQDEEKSSNIAIENGMFSTDFTTGSSITENFEGSAFNTKFKWDSNFNTPNGFTKRTDYKHSGTSSGYIGTTSHNRFYYSQTTVKGSKVSFWYLVSCESGPDDFSFYIDGARKLNASGTSMTAMKHVEYELNPTKNSTIKFEYRTDSSVYSGKYGFFIDDLTVTNKVFVDKATFVSKPVAASLFTKNTIKLNLVDYTAAGDVSYKTYYSLDSGATYTEFTEVDKSELNDSTIFKVEFTKTSTDASISFKALEVISESSGPIELSLNFDLTRTTTVSVMENYVTRRTLRRSENLLSDTQRAVNAIVDVMIKSNTKRSISSATQLFIDTNRKSAEEAKIIADTKRKVAIQQTLTLETKRNSYINLITYFKTNREIVSITKIPINLSFITKRIVDRKDNISFDTKRVTTDFVHQSFNNVISLFNNDSYADTDAFKLNSAITGFKVRKATITVESNELNTLLVGKQNFSIIKGVQTLIYQVKDGQEEYELIVKPASYTSKTSMNVSVLITDATQYVAKAKDGITNAKLVRITNASYLEKDGDAFTAYQTAFYKRSPINVFDSRTNKVKETFTPFDFDARFQELRPTGSKDYYVSYTKAKPIKVRLYNKTNRIKTKEIKVLCDTDRVLREKIKIAIECSTRRRISTATSIKSNTRRRIYISKTSVFETLRSIRANTNTIANTKRKISKLEQSLIDTNRRNLIDFSLNFDANRKVSVKKLLVSDAKRSINKNISLLLDTHRFVSETESCIVNLAVNTKRNITAEIRTVTDTKRVTSVLANISSDTKKVTCGTVKLIADVTRGTIIFHSVNTDTKRATSINYTTSFDTERTYGIGVKTCFNASRTIHIAQKVTAKTKRAIKVANNSLFDLERKLAIQHIASSDTMRTLVTGVSVDITADTIRQVSNALIISSDTKRKVAGRRIQVNYDLVRSMTAPVDLIADTSRLTQNLVATNFNTHRAPMCLAQEIKQVLEIELTDTGTALIETSRTLKNSLTFELTAFEPIFEVEFSNEPAFEVEFE